MIPKYLLPDSPNLDQFQCYIREMKKLRGLEFDKNKALILLMEEVGELCKEVRATWEQENISNERAQNIKLEIADVFVYVLELANQFEISLEQAFRDKEAINLGRQWKNSRV